MALALKLHRGDDFFVDGKQVWVKRIAYDSSFTLETEAGELVEVNADFATELFPSVMVSASQNSESGLAKLLVEAPRSIRILLGELYRRPRPEAIDRYLFGPQTPQEAPGRPV